MVALKVCAAALLAAVFVVVPARSESLAITGATVIDGVGATPLSDATIVLTDGRIAALGPAAKVAIPRGAQKLDARGKYVIPGLMDANIHLALPDLETTIKYEDRLHELALEAAQVTLRSGLTTVFDTYGPRAALVRTRDAINAGKVPGSRIYLAGSIIGFTGPLGEDMRDPQLLGFVSQAFAKRFDASYEEGIGPELLALSPDQVRPFIREYARKSVDFLKYGSSGHGFWPEIATFNHIAFSPRVQKAIVEEGHRAGLTVQAHTTTVESLDLAIDAGADIITHGDISGLTTPLPPDVLQKLAERRIPVSVIPITQRNLDAELEHLARFPPKGYAFPQFQKLSKVNQINMIKAGVVLLMSTDSVMPAPDGRFIVDARNIGEGHFNALVALEEMGMAPLEILKSATVNIARAYKVDKDLGTLEAGKAADLLILDRDPLAGARNYRSIAFVIKGGRVVDRTALPVKPILGVRGVADAAVKQSHQAISAQKESRP